ncbi:MFS general substrate transporter [Mycena latifolia]|nr:MFS general substrate transporter [Mycena latifolia]
MSSDPNPHNSGTVTLHDAELDLILGKTHDGHAPDLNFPFQTTNTSEGGVTDEYRVSTKSGLTDARHALHPVLLQVAELLNALADPEKAKKNSRKSNITAVVALAVVAVAFGSAVVTGDFEDIEADALTVSLMVVGFGIGPLAWSPLSELYGRRPLWIIPFIFYVVFNIPCALAPNIQSLLVCRFLCGLFTSASLTLAGGAISDIWDNNERGLAIALFAAAPTKLGWRWILWVNMIFAGVILLLCATLPETFAPVILRKRATKLRTETGRDDIVLAETLVRPFQMIVTEPILLLMSLFIALIYGLLYAFFFSFPVVFGEGYVFSDGVVGLTFCSVLIGVGLGLLVTPFLEKDYLKRPAAKGGRADPEDRLVGMILAGPFVPICMSLLAVHLRLDEPPVRRAPGGHWVGPASAGIPFCFGMGIIYFSANAYLVDAFPGYVASARAAKTVIRSGAGAAMSLFVVQMFHGLGNGWAASLLTFVSLAWCIPIPILFYRYGKAIRAQSKRAA